MPFSIRPFRRFPVQCSVTYNAGPFQGQGTIWNVSCTGWRLFGDLPMDQGKPFLSPSHSRMSNVSRCRKPWFDSRGRQEFAVENLAIQPHTRARLQHYVKRLLQEPRESTDERKRWFSG